MYTSHQILCLLDRVLRDYPSGIPQSAIKTVVASQPLCALLCVGCDEPLSDLLSDLAQAICTKGLRLTAEQYVIRAIPAPFDCRAHLPEILEEIGCSYAILCGGSLKPGELSTVGGVEVLQSYDLAQISNDAALKRRFWEHLQSIIPQIHAKQLS